jgi:hypothetical protein
MRLSFALSSAQEWQVNQLDGNPLIPVGFGRVGQLKKLARGSAKRRPELRSLSAEI